MTRIHLRSTCKDGHFRAGLLITAKGFEVTLAGSGNVTAPRINEEQLRQLRADDRVVVTELATDDPAPISEDEALRRDVVGAIDRLDGEDFGADGKPKVGALREALPERAEQITAALRDTVWAEIQTMGVRAGV